METDLLGGSQPNGGASVDCDSTIKKSKSGGIDLRSIINPLVELIYWRDVKKTGVAFGSIMVILLSLAYISLISVVAYSSLTVLAGTITFRLYKETKKALKKSDEGHAFKEYLEYDTELSQSMVQDASLRFVKELNTGVAELKRLFFVEDIIDSVKFGCLLWCFTYLGSWFNGLTLVILAVVSLFSLPKVYEQNQEKIDEYVGLVKGQVNGIMTKISAAIPIGKKEKAQ